MDPHALAQTIADAYARRVTIPTPSSSDGNFNLGAAYATEASLVALRRAGGHKTVGLKVGFANKAVWRVMKLETLVWAHMYDDTVSFATDGASTLSTASLISPKIEPEVVFKIARASAIEPGVDATTAAPADVLAHVEWLAIGFEIIDCPYPDWKFQPADFVAAYGLHAALVIGKPLEVEAGAIPELVDQLVAIHRAPLARWRSGGRRLGQELVAQPGPLPRGAAGGNRAPARSDAPRRGRPRQLGNADRVTADCRGSVLARRRRWDRSGAVDAELLIPLQTFAAECQRLDRHIRAFRVEDGSFPLPRKGVEELPPDNRLPLIVQQDDDAVLSASRYDTCAEIRVGCFLLKYDSLVSSSVTISRSGPRNAMCLKRGSEETSFAPPRPVNGRSNDTATLRAARRPIFLTDTDSRPLSNRNSTMTSGRPRAVSAPATLRARCFLSAMISKDLATIEV